MLEIFLIRHGQTEWNHKRRIMGRLPIPLNAMGRRQARTLRRILRNLTLRAIYTSPVRRALETAQEIARGHRLKVILAPAVAEINYGRWVGKTFDEVSYDPAYQTYHTTPSRAKAPGGERMTAVARRAVRFIERLRSRYQDGRVVVVSHADVIKTILIYYLRLPLNDLLKVRIDNASLSSLWFDGRRTRVLAINGHADLRKLFLRTDQLLPQPKRGR